MGRVMSFRIFIMTATQTPTIQTMFTKAVVEMYFCHAENTKHLKAIHVLWFSHT